MTFNTSSPVSGCSRFDIGFSWSCRCLEWLGNLSEGETILCLWNWGEEVSSTALPSCSIGATGSFGESFQIAAVGAPFGIFWKARLYFAWRKKGGKGKLQVVVALKFATEADDLQKASFSDPGCSPARRLLRSLGWGTARELFNGRLSPTEKARLRRATCAEAFPAKSSKG